MKKIFTLLPVLYMLSCTTEPASDNVLTETEKAEGWQLLFDGSTMNGWKQFKGGDTCYGWIVDSGCMVSQDINTDHAADIITRKEFKDFDLKLEWKITPVGNSGVFIHAKEDSVDAIYKIAPEYQLLDDIGWGNKVSELQKSGANYAMHAPDTAIKKLKPLGEFNSTRIVVKDSLVQHWLNGEKIVEYKLWSDDWNSRKAEGKWKDAPLYGSMKSGSIGLQNHGKKVYIKNIKIKEL